jgi:hypothetical protein
MSYDPTLFIDRQRELSYLDRLLRHERSKAVMRIRAGEWMGKSWLVGRMGKHCRESDCQVACAEVDFRNRREQHEVQDTLSLVRLLRSKLNRPDHFSPLNAVINSFTAAATQDAGRPGAAVSALHLLAERMKDVYVLNELARLSQFLGVVWDDVAGDTLYLKCYNLAGQMYRSGRLPDLLDRLRAERGHVDWSQGLEALTGEGAALPVPGGDTQGVEDRLAPLADEGILGRSLAERRINEAFFECLARLVGQVPVAFFFDGCEQAPREAMAWIRHQLLDRLRTGELANLVVILAGRDRADLSDVDVDRLLVDVELDGFDEERVGEFLAAYGLEVSSEEQDLLARASRGVPGLLARMVDNLRAEQDSRDPFLDG